MNWLRKFFVTTVACFCTYEHRYSSKITTEPQRFRRCICRYFVHQFVPIGLSALFPIIFPPLCLQNTSPVNRNNSIFTSAIFAAYACLRLPELLGRGYLANISLAKYKNEAKSASAQNNIDGGSSGGGEVRQQHRRKKWQANIGNSLIQTELPLRRCCRRKSVRIGQTVGHFSKRLRQLTSEKSGV